MAKKIIYLADKFQQQLENELAKINPKSNIASLYINAHYSIWNDVGLVNSKHCFYPNGMTPENIFTRGEQFRNFAKAFNTLYTCKYITDIEISIVKSWKSWISMSHRNSKYYNSDNEYRVFDYHVVVNIIGITVEAFERERLLAEERAKIEAERIERENKIKEHIAYYKDLNKNETYQCVGCANEWPTRDNEPEIVKIADDDKDHYYDHECIGRCLTKCISHKYKFYFTIDSSD